MSIPTGDPYEPPPPGPVSPPETLDENGNPITILDGGGTDPTTPPAETPPLPAGDGTDTTVQDLYPDTPETGEFDVPDVPDATGADIAQSNLDEGNVTAPTDATANTGNIVQGAVDEIAAGLGAGEQTNLTAEQQVDAELTRIL